MREKEILDLICEINAQVKNTSDIYYNSDRVYRAINKIIKMYEEGMNVEDIKFCIYKNHKFIDKNKVAGKFNDLYMINLYYQFIKKGFNKEQILFLIDPKYNEYLSTISKGLEYDLNFDQLKSLLDIKLKNEKEFEILSYQVILSYYKTGLTAEDIKPFIDKYINNMKNLSDFFNAVRKTYNIDVYSNVEKELF